MGNDTCAEGCSSSTHEPRDSSIKHKSGHSSSHWASHERNRSIANRFLSWSGSSKYDSLRFYDVTPNSCSRYVEISCHNFAEFSPYVSMCGCNVSHICDSFFLIEFVTHSNMNGPPLAQSLGAMLADFRGDSTIAIYVPPAADWTDNNELEEKYSKQSAAIDSVRDLGPQGRHSKSIMARMGEHKVKLQANKDDWMDVRSESMTSMNTCENH